MIAIQSILALKSNVICVGDFIIYKSKIIYHYLKQDKLCSHILMQCYEKDDKIKVAQVNEIN